MRDAGHDDLYALQQGADPGNPFDFRAAPRDVFHKNCGGRISYQPGSGTIVARYTCNGVSKSFGACAWSYRCDAVHAWTKSQVAAALYLGDVIDERVYALELVTGKKGEVENNSYYRLRPASTDEAYNYVRGNSDTWKVK